MQRKILKQQAVLFGNFHFPASPETTVKLLTAFASLGFMPQVLNISDPTSGLTVPKISLAKDEKQIIFGSDRIDIISAAPVEAELNLDFFIAEVKDYFLRIESGTLKMYRIAIVEDYFLEGLSEAQSESLRTSLVPKSAVGSIEWASRWVTPSIIEDEKYNICLEAMVASGMRMVLPNRVIEIDGVKILHDISTSPESLMNRFGSDNLLDSLKKVATLIEFERAFVQAQF